MSNPARKRKAGGEGKKGKKFVEDKAALLTLIEDLPRWDAPRSRPNQPLIAPDSHLAAVDEEGYEKGIVAFDEKAKSKKGKGKGKGKAKAKGEDGEGFGASGVNKVKPRKKGDEDGERPKKVNKLQENKQALDKAKALILAKDKQRKKSNKLEKTGEPSPAAEKLKKRKSVGFAV